MTVTDSGTPARHDDPAVQALIDDAWTGMWDYPVAVDDLVNAVALIRRTDRQHAELIRTEYAAVAVLTNGEHTRTEAHTDRATAVALTVGMAGALKAHAPNSPTRQMVQGYRVESREVRRTTDGWEMVSPWQPVPGTETDQ